jgi:hypothetical protein
VLTGGSTSVLKYSASRTLRFRIKRRHPDGGNRDCGLKPDRYCYIYVDMTPDYESQVKSGLRSVIVHREWAAAEYIFLDE